MKEAKYYLMAYLPGKEFRAFKVTTNEAHFWMCIGYNIDYIMGEHNGAL